VAMGCKKGRWQTPDESWLDMKAVEEGQAVRLCQRYRRAQCLGSIDERRGREEEDPQVSLRRGP
jgi:hypothetical protein